MDKLIQQIKGLSRERGRETPEWLSSAESVIEFLKESARSETLVLYASTDSILIHAVLAPLANLEPPDQSDLSNDFVKIDDCWGIEHVSGGGEPDRVYLAPPLHGSWKTLKGGEKLLFRRFFEGRSSSPIEISQKLVHSLRLHFMQERNAYCRLDEDGDIEDVIKIIDQRSKDCTQDITVVSVLAKEFAKYLRLAEMGMVVFFDFTRTRYGSFGGWTGVKPFHHRTRDLFYRGGVMGTEGSYVNGRMIIRPRITYDDIVQEHVERRNPANREYVTFKAIDLRSGDRIEVSCNPTALSNYFQPDSPLPLEMSPVFFKAEVLHKYKADSEKYELKDRSVQCRGAWSLETFDINERGQVHSYLRYLGMLPYKEQLYWQSFNEWPKGSISQRAFTTDFKGEFYEGLDPLNSLKHRISRLNESEPLWWQPRDETLSKFVHLPATDSASEWANEILALDQLVNEGFREQQLRSLAQTLGSSPEPEWRSFKLLEECLKAKGADLKAVAVVVRILRTVRDLRNVLKGHAATTKRTERVLEARTKFGSLRKQFERLAADVDGALKFVVEILAPTADNTDGIR